MVPSWSFIDVLGKLFVGALKSDCATTGLSINYVGDLSSIAQVRREPLWHRHCALSQCHIVFINCCRGGFVSFPIKLVLPGAMKIAESAPKDLGTVVTSLLTNAVANPISALVEGNYLAILSGPY